MRICVHKADISSKVVLHLSPNIHFCDHFRCCLFGKNEAEGRQVEDKAKKWLAEAESMQDCISGNTET